MDKRLYTLYLAGQISNDKKTYLWREKVREVFADNKNILIIDPCCSEYNDERVGQDLISFYKEKGHMLLPAKDRNYVNISNVIMFNMNIYTPEKPMVGTFYELAWAFDKNDTMCIGIYNGEPKDDFVCNHPFVKSTIAVWTKNEDEASELLLRYMDRPSY
jgi:hypothetical protein